MSSATWSATGETCVPLGVGGGPRPSSGPAMLAQALQCRRRKFLVGMPLGSAPITVLAATASPAVAAWAVAGIGWLGAAWV